MKLRGTEFGLEVLCKTDKGEEWRSIDYFNASSDISIERYYNEPVPVASLPVPLMREGEEYQMTGDGQIYIYKAHS